MAVFVMMVGLPGSGKDFIVEHELKGYVHISSDAIREEVFGDVNDQTHNTEVFQIMSRRTIEALREGKDCVYNATNLSAKRRMAFLHSIAHIPNVTKICILNAPPFELVKERNASRERVVPEYVLDRMLKQFEIPHKSEGWNMIYIYGIDDNVDALNEIVDNAMTISHDNPHHEDTIGNHMYNAGMYAECGTGADVDVCDAALYHDIGKLFCKVFQDSKGNPTEIAHYYNHENVGAYIFLSHAKGLKNFLHTANLIAHHMDYFKGEKYIKKIRERFGEGFMADLDIVHEADLMAH